MIVVDTNVVVYALIEGTDTELARKVRHLDPLWLVPELWRHEFLNVLVMYVRKRGLALEQADSLWRQATELLTDCIQPVSMSLTLRLATEHKISGYDAQFVALAQTLGVSLITEDRGLRRQFPGVAISMASFCAV